VGEKNLTEKNFAEIVNGKKPVLVDFWAPWCGPCQTMTPIIAEIAEEMADVTVGKINISDCPKLAEKFNVMSIPTFLVFKNGKVVDQIVGAVQKEEIIKTIKKNIDK